MARTVVWFSAGAASAIAAKLALNRDPVDDVLKRATPQEDHQP
jgi:hypothetical protein